MMFEQLISRARALKKEVHAVYLAAKDPRTPWFAKALISFIVAYTVSPIDLIPDFIPILGYLDDLVIVPLGVALAILMIPPEVLDEARENVKQAQGPERNVKIVGMTLIVLLWIGILAIIYRLITSASFLTGN
jgi:uncharacterized membrane protein YkvA (DUF1232 family)